tara:strand:+ start:2692 stop:2973 length:282 start_codon:yes stop_codon:yes gene_type:complete
MNREQILAIEDEVIDGMTNAGAKESLSALYKRTREDGRRYPSTLVLNRIRYYMRLGYSNLTTEELESLYDKKMYYERNGDINENKDDITHSKK